MFKSFFRLRAYIVLTSIFSLFVLSACAPTAQKSLTSELVTSKTGKTKACILPENQRATLMGRWPRAPIPIALQKTTQLFFSDFEKAEVVKGLDHWNEFTAESLNSSFFNYGASADQVNTVNSLPDSSLCSHNLFDSSGNFLSQKQTAIFKRAPWNGSGPSGSGYPANVIALTTTCYSTSGGLVDLNGVKLPSFYNGVIELNYTDFWGSKPRQPDVRSIVTHEVGHLIGLDHSCKTGESAAGFAGCGSSGLPESYRAAVMFPVFNFIKENSLERGEQRFELNENDQGRTNCVYKGLTADDGRSLAGE